MTDIANKPASRRSFVKALAGGLAALTAAVASALPARRVKAQPAEAKRQYGMVIDVNRCIGCQACTVACKAEFDVPLGENRAWVEYVEKGEYANVGRSFLPRLCNHCSEPPCVSVCPTNATYKREQDGIVVIDDGLCIGCKYCVLACPYDARFLNPVTNIADRAISASTGSPRAWILPASTPVSAAPASSATSPIPTATCRR